MAKLPIWPTVKAAYATVWTHRWRLLRFAVVPFALMTAIDAGGTHLSEAMAVNPGGGAASVEPPAAIVLEQFAWLLNSIVLIAFIVPCYRVLLLGRATFEPGNRRAGRRAYLGMLAITLLLALVFEVPIALLDLPSHSLGSEGVIAAQIALTLGFFWVTIKLAFLSPTICLARPWNLRQRWRETSGNFWRLVAAVLAVLLPVIAAVVLWAASLGLWDEISGTAISWSPVWEAMTVAAAWLISEALAAAVIVIAFAHLTGYPAKGVNRRVTMDESYERWFQMFNLESPADPDALVAFELEAGFALPTGYARFLMKSNGGWGEIGEHYLQLWAVEELLSKNRAYEVEEFAPGLFLFGSDGGGEAFAFDRERTGMPIVMVPFIPLRREEAVDVAPTFDGFLERLHSEASLLGSLSPEEERELDRKIEREMESISKYPPYEPGQPDPWPVASIHSYVDQCESRFEAAQSELENAYGIGAFDRYQYDIGSGRLDLLAGDEVKLSFHVLPIGSWSPTQFTWCWAWGDPSLPEWVVEKLEPLAALAQDDSWPFYDGRQYKARLEDAWFMAALALEVLGGLGAYRVPEEPQVFLLLTALHEDNR